MTSVASETTFWSEKGLNSRECCCCSKDGCVKDIYTEYYDLGVREMYLEIILDTFNININLKESNMIWKQYICDPCIKQLRNAYSFKCNILKNYEAMLERIKEMNDRSEQDIKYETNQFQDEFYEDGISEVFFDRDKTLVNGLKRKKLKANPNFIKKEDVETSDLKSKQKSKITRKRTKRETKPKLDKKKDGLDTTRKTSKTTINKYKIVAKSTIFRKNSIKLITNSSVWVFNWCQGRYRCFCCKEPYSDINLLKEHTETHKIEEIEAKIQNSENNLVKVEVSDVSCKICRKNFDNLDCLIDHLKLHDIIINGHILVPIKINELNCQICHEKYSNFHILYLHMIKHYQTFICDKCGAGFYQKRHLKQHIRKNHDQNRTKKIPRPQLKCNYCSERFKQFHIRIEHMVEKHGLEKPEFRCEICNKIYITKGILNAHIKNSHILKDKVFECDVCLKTFSIKNNLVRHKYTHTDGINFNCSVCNHGFKLITSLRRHVKQKH